MMKFRSVLLVVLICLSALSHAEQKRTLGQWDVHYMAVNTTFLTPQIARSYDIVRSENNMLINISVLDRTSNKAQQVSLTGTARNLLGNTKTLEFKQVIDGQAIYYLAVMPFDDEEHYRFSITISQGQIEQELKFEQKLYR